MRLKQDRSVPANAYSWQLLDPCHVSDNKLRAVYQNKSMDVWLSITPCTANSHHACLFAESFPTDELVTKAEFLLSLIETQLDIVNKTPVAVSPKTGCSVSDAYDFASID